nr:PREDICTED: mediator of RNA polymerase II transcription subunit 11-like [Bemisia tabaci]
MNKTSAPMERIQALDAIEKDIITCLQAAGFHAKNQTSQKQFTPTKTRKLQGSGYASQKVLQMAWHRLEHVRSRVMELDRISRINKERMNQSQERMNQAPPPPGPKQ